MGRTKDEIFMLKLYEELSKKNNFDLPIDPYLIGQAIGLQKKATDTICNTLAQANFIKKEEESQISLTPHGLRLIENIR